MKVPQLRAGQTKRVRDARLFDVHVKQVAKQFHVLRAELPQQVQRVGDVIEQIRFIAVERFQEQRHAVILSVRSEFFERLGQPTERLIAGDAAFPAPLHGTNDRRGAETAGDLDDRRGELLSALTRFGVGIRQAQLVNHPARARADRRELETMLSQEVLELLNVQFLSRAGENLHGVESERSRPLASGGKVVPENEGSAARFRNQRNRNRRSHLSSDAYQLDCIPVKLRRIR